MNKPGFFCTGLLITISFVSTMAQTTVQNGDWQTGSTWNSGDPLRVTNVGADNQNITVSAADSVQVGAYGNDVGLTFATNKEAYTLLVDVNSVLVIYGDVEFSNKAMNLAIDGTVVIFGDLTVNNKLEISSSGTLVVTGTFAKNGSANQGSYTGTGKVYAGAYDGAADDFIPGTTEDGGDQQQLISDLEPDGEDALSDFVAGGGEDPLPVTIQDFSLRQNKESVSLHWITQSEENFDFFEIQRADDRMTFETIATVKGNGNSKTAINYTWTDENPLPGTNYYRLVSNDFDGYKEIFKALFVSFESAENTLTIFPNPALANAQISVRGSFHNEVVVKIYNINGKLEQVFSKTNNFFDLPRDLKTGIYIIELSSNGLTKRERLIIR